MESLKGRFRGDPRRNSEPKVGRTYSRSGDKIGAHSCAAAKLAMAGIHSGVNNIDGSSAPSGGIVDVSGGSWASVGDTAESVGSSSLGTES